MPHIAVRHPTMSSRFLIMQAKELPGDGVASFIASQNGLKLQVGLNYKHGMAHITARHPAMCFCFLTMQAKELPGDGEPALRTADGKTLSGSVCNRLPIPPRRPSSGRDQAALRRAGPARVSQGRDLPRISCPHSTPVALSRVSLRG